MSAARSDIPRLLHVFSNFVASGPELRTVALMNAFGPRFSHLVVSMDGRLSALGHVNADVAIRVLQPPSKRGVIRSARAIRELLHREAPDVLLTYNWGAFDALLAALPVRLKGIIHHEDGFNSDEATRLKLRRTWARRLVLRSTTGVVVPSHTLARIARTRWGLAPPRLRLIPNGVDASKLEPATPRGVMRASLGIPSTVPLIGTVAHLRREKRLDRIVEVLAAFPPDRRPHVVIVGEGPERPVLESAARHRHVADWLHLVGAQRQVGDYLHAFDVFLLTSDTEQMPVSLLEAMCCGLPAVATQVGDVEQMIPAAQRRWTVPITNEGELIRSLADACGALVRSSGLRAELGASNREHVNVHYSFDAMVRRYEEVYRAALLLPSRPFEPALGTR